MKVLREEFFGSVLYDPSTAQYSYLNAEQTGSFIEHNTQFRSIKNQNRYADRLSAPLKVFFNITKRCNLFCRHCYNDSGKVDSPELSLAVIENTFLECEARGIFKVTVAGGEPLFHPDFDQVMDAWEKTMLNVSIVTNGICVNEKRAKRLGSSPNVGSITVSLDGANASDNDAVRGENAFSRALRGISLLKKYYHKSLAVRITIMRSNMDNVDKLPQLLAGLGINEIKVNAVNAYGRAEQENDLLITQAEYLATRDKLFENALKLGMSVEIPSQKYQRDENDQIGLCKAGEETFEIDGDGSVYPCSFAFGRFLAGNVQSTPFDEIIYNLQAHSINNPWCYQCKGRGGKAEKAVGRVLRLMTYT